MLRMQLSPLVWEWIAYGSVLTFKNEHFESLFGED